MTQFDDREKAFEKGFVRNKDFEFKASARRNKLLGQWAAAKMGLEGEAKDAYAKQVVIADFEEVGDEDVYRKVKGDLEDKGIEISEHELRRQMEDFMAKAKEQLSSEE